MSSAQTEWVPYFRRTDMSKRRRLGCVIPRPGFLVFVQPSLLLFWHVIGVGALHYVVFLPHRSNDKIPDKNLTFSILNWKRGVVCTQKCRFLRQEAPEKRRTYVASHGLRLRRRTASGMKALRLSRTACPRNTHHCVVQSLPDNTTIALYDSFFVPKRIFLYL